MPHFDKLGVHMMSYADEPIVLWLDFTRKLWYASFQISTALKSRFSIDNWWDRVDSQENWRILAWHPNLNVLKAYFGSILYMPKWGFGWCWNNCSCIWSSWASRSLDAELSSIVMADLCFSFCSKHPYLVEPLDKTAVLNCHEKVVILSIAVSQKEMASTIFMTMSIELDMRLEQHLRNIIGMC